jgi:transposase
MTKALMAGIDLHSNNLMIGIVDEEGQRVGHQKLACELKAVVEFLKPYQGRLKSLAVESTYNWYWLVDGLRALGYPVVLANPAKIDQYSGLKHGDDKSDAYFLAELQRLKILPTGYIYDAVTRPVRDLLRRRVNLVEQRTALILSFKSLY